LRALRFADSVYPYQLIPEGLAADVGLVQARKKVVSKRIENEGKKIS
jgi:hypothetical protein